MDEAWYVNAGLFADNADFALTLQMFTDCQAPYYHWQTHAQAHGAAVFRNGGCGGVRQPENIPHAATT